MQTDLKYLESPAWNGSGFCFLRFWVYVCGGALKFLKMLFLCLCDVVVMWGGCSLVVVFLIFFVIVFLGGCGCVFVFNWRCGCVLR